jgi:hypothetical protein
MTGTMTCDICSAKVTELRRGRCWGCYNRWVEARPVGLGAQCCVCGERRRNTLKSVELLGAWMPMCFNCSGQAMKLDPMPQTLGGVRTALQRDRRRLERRWGKRDTRVFQYDRRNGDRRNSVRDEWVQIDEDMIVDCDDLKACLDELAESLDQVIAEREPEGELTQIREAPL